MAGTQERWPRVEQPILDALASGDGSDMSDEQVEAATGIEHTVVTRALRDLKEAEYINCVLVEADQVDYPLRAAGIRLLPKGLRQAGLWPTDDFGAAFVAALEKAIEHEPDEEERTKLRGAITAVKAVGGMALNAAIANAVGIGKAHLGLN